MRSQLQLQQSNCLLDLWQQIGIEGVEAGACTYSLMHTSIVNTVATVRVCIIAAYNEVASKHRKSMSVLISGVRVRNEVYFHRF